MLVCVHVNAKAMGSSVCYMVPYVNHKYELLMKQNQSTLRGCGGSMEGRKNLKKIFLCSA